MLISYLSNNDLEVIVNIKNNTELEQKLNNSLQKFFLSISKELENYCHVEMGDIKLSNNLILDYSPIEDKKDIKFSNGKYDLISDWKYYFPYSDSAGVYIFLDRDEQIMYIGMSLRAMGKRICSHLGKRVKNASGKSIIDYFPNNQFKNENYVPRYVVCIPFDVCPFLAPAFEVFMIEEYSPPYNAILKNL